jgi:hypothetical protein
MQKILFGMLLLSLAFIVGCASGPETRNAERYADHQLCPQERPQVCTMEYNPVCARLEDGRNKEFPSACSACSQAEVVAYKPDACP